MANAHVGLVQEMTDNKFIDRKDHIITAYTIDIINYYVHNMTNDYYINKFIENSNIISYKVLLNPNNDYEQVKQNIISSLTLKVVPVISNNKKRFEVMIVIDQLNKYCTCCETVKENIHFTNKFNKIFTLYFSDFESYMFSCCNECFDEERIIMKVNRLQLFMFDKTIKYRTIRTAYEVKLYIEKAFNKNKQKKLLNIYFIIKCKLGKDLAQYIFSFIKKNILCDVRQ
jgi:hypothetical protein